MRYATLVGQGDVCEEDDGRLRKVTSAVGEVADKKGDMTDTDTSSQVEKPFAWFFEAGCGFLLFARMAGRM